MSEQAAALPAHWYVVPAAGSGSRFGGTRPKQYAALAGRALLLWTIEALLTSVPRGILVVVSENDPWIDELSLTSLSPTIEIHRTGGATRARSVAAGLAALDGRAEERDLVLVHDAARPCLAPANITALLRRAADHADGALLALPVVETVKEAGPDDTIRGTRARDGLWLAQTPQAFGFRRLRDALEAALGAEQEITDEASAIEQAGGAPALVAGDRANLKVTRPEDLAFAEAWLGRRGAMGA